MQKRKYDRDDSMYITTDALQRITGLPRNRAIEIATEAGARLEFGRSVLWHREKALKAAERLAE